MQKESKTVLIISPHYALERCGVSDYSHVLMQHLQRDNYLCFMLALSDAFIDSDEQAHNVVRLSAQTPVNKRIQKLGQIITEVKPAIVILNFVSYGYQKKGLPFWLMKCMPLFEGDFSLQLIMHELWTGIERKNIKELLLGYIQKKLIIRFLVQLPHANIITTSLFTRQLLAKQNIKATNTSVFTNIRGHATEPMLPASITSSISSNEYVKVVVFETAINLQVLNDMMAFLEKHSTTLGKRVLLIVLGHTKRTAAVEYLQNNPSSFLTVYQAGYLSTAEMVWIFTQANMGISGYPTELWTKSGAIAGMLAHGLPVICFGKLEPRPEIINSSMQEGVYEWPHVETLYSETSEPKKMSAGEYNLICYETLLSHIEKQN